MSGVIGLFRRDGRPVVEAECQAMADTLSHRGPDARRVLVMGEAGLGHTMLWTTPESLHEELPRVDMESGLAITADARIDNRDELIATLGLGGPPAAISDSDLVLAAYRKWSYACPEQLAGDFAFAIWDSRRHELFCARDPMGVKCLYYFAGPSLFALGSEIKALCALAEIPRRLNELRVLDFLANIFADRSITFFKDIHRLPAASTLLVSRSGLAASTYWSPDPRKELKLRSEQEYSEAFGECFQRAVRDRTRSAYPVGAALSGGLDSSSIACLARDATAAQGPLRTFSLIFPGLPPRALKAIDEREYIQDVLAAGGFEPHFVRGDEISPMTELPLVHEHLDEAFFEGNLYLNWALYRAAAQADVRVFLDGLDGDTTVSHGFEYFADLVLGLRWWTLGRELRAMSANLGIPAKRGFRDFCVKPLCPTWVYTAWRKLHGRPADAGVLSTFMATRFRERAGMDDRIRQLVPTQRSCTQNAREKHREMITFPLYAHALEVVDKASAAFRVEARYPFFDRRLIELCVSLPASMKFRHGWSRFVLRRAMRGVLPESVCWRPSKANLSPNFYSQMLQRDRHLLEAVIMSDCEELEPYIDMSTIRRAYRDYDANPLGRDQEPINIFAAVNLALWLRSAGVRP
jgi:asparagine synthase (glutamine-hydrolysing)